MLNKPYNFFYTGDPQIGAFLSTYFLLSYCLFFLARKAHHLAFEYGNLKTFNINIEQLTQLELAKLNIFRISFELFCSVFSVPEEGTTRLAPVP
jgi:hypothetical protein